MLISEEDKIRKPRRKNLAPDFKLKLREVWLTNRYTYEQIAKQFNLNVNTVLKAINDVAPKNSRDITKSRTCLKCHKDFKSYGSGNRICSTCRGLQPAVNEYSISYE